MGSDIIFNVIIITELNYTEKIKLGDSQRQQVPKDEAHAPAAVPPAVEHSDSV